MIIFCAFQRGPNKIPLYALFVVTSITLIFIFIGKVNTLGPIVTMPFMLTYAAVDYCYFCLAMSFDKRKAREDRFHSSVPHNPVGQANGTVPSPQHNYGAINGKKDDLDKLFPERMEQHGQPLHHRSNDSLGSPTFVTDEKAPPGAERKPEVTEDTAGLLEKDLLGWPLCLAFLVSHLRSLSSS